MPVICFPNCCFLSETSRMVEIYKKLQELDLPAIMVTHSGTYEFVLRAAKIPFEKIGPYIHKEDCQHTLKVISKPWIKLYKKATLQKTVENEINFFRENNADAVITGFQLSLALSARGAQIPLIVTHLGSFVPPIFEKGLFSVSEHFDNILTRFFPTEKLNSIFAGLIQNAPFQLKLFNKVADELGIPQIRSFVDLMMGDLTLVTDVPEILGISEKELESWKPSDNKHYRPETKLKYAGAIFAKLFGEVPQKVINFLKTDRPKIYVAMASGKKENLQKVYETLLKMNVRAVFCSLIYSESFKSTENILVVDFLPSHLVMPLCDLAIIHGGQGSVQTAIASGIPLIGFPIQPEQNFNLKQVERHGAGLCLSLKSLSKDNLNDSINRVLKDKRYKKSMEKLQEWQARRDGAFETAKAVQNLIEN